MRKIICALFLCSIIILVVISCKIKKEVSIDELNNINDEIIGYFNRNGTKKYDNFSYNYVDEKEKVVVVGLIDNSKKEQKWFSKNIVDSKYLRFEKAKRMEDDYLNVSKKIDIIVNNGPQASSNPFDYIKASQKEYDDWLENKRVSFEYAIKDLIDTNANNGLKSYIEALLCKEINKNFEYDFESADDYLKHYKEFLSKNNIDFNEYDKYAKSLIK